MRIFEFPYFFITALIVLLFGAAMLFFLVRGVKTETDEKKNSFEKISRLERCFNKSGRMRENRGVLYVSISLDHYRNLYSQERAEKVYAALRQILLQSFSPEHNSLISIYGEFAYVAFTSLGAEQARHIAEDYQAALGKCLIDYSALNIIEVRVGAFYALGSEITFDEAIQRAKQACILAKNANLVYAEWDAFSGKALENKIKIENNIENAIDNNRFFLVYQPIVDAKTKEIFGSEVLARLKAAGEGIIHPAKFLSAVDSVGLHSKFNYYIFDKCCKWIAEDRKQRERYLYTINFSRFTLSDPAFIEKFLDIAEKYELNPSCLAVEVLEDINVTDEAKEKMTANLVALKERGISVLLDDFGSGYASFDDLNNTAISIVKIDSSITKNAVTESGYIILENIIRMAKSIGFLALCEGVETKEQEEAAIRAGCDLLQGYYYYKPLSATMLEDMLGTEGSDAETT